MKSTIAWVHNLIVSLHRFAYTARSVEGSIKFRSRQSVGGAKARNLLGYCSFGLVHPEFPTMLAALSDFMDCVRFSILEMTRLRCNPRADIAGDISERRKWFRESS